MKKLRLAKETVRNLSFGRGHVLGGAYTDDYYSCACTATTNTCPHTADRTCDCGYSGDWTCDCNSNVFACPITAGDSCIGC